MSNKLKTAFWFIKNPRYFSQIFQVLKRKKNAQLENTLEEATLWCAENSVSVQVALQKLTALNDAQEFKTLYPEYVEHAIRRAKEAPVQMGGEGAVSFIYHLIKQSDATHILETGVAYGWSSLAILAAIKSRGGAKLISNDMPYINMGNDDYVGCVVPDELKDKWELQRYPDVKGIPLALNKFQGTIDICHYDSDKSYTGRMWASPLIWKALKEGGLFISDDINDNIAFKEFCEKVKRVPVIIEHHGKYVGVIIK
ncbi:MAG: class I SAM-dependent methyltransferase [Ferruginibacter sp.]